MKINTTGRKCTLKPAFLNSVEEKLGYANPNETVYNDIQGE